MKPRKTKSKEKFFNQFVIELRGVELPKSKTYKVGQKNTRAFMRTGAPMFDDMRLENLNLTEHFVWVGLVCLAHHEGRHRLVTTTSMIRRWLAKGTLQVTSLRRVLEVLENKGFIFLFEDYEDIEDYEGIEDLEDLVVYGRFEDIPPADAGGSTTSSNVVPNVDQHHRHHQHHDIATQGVITNEPDVGSTSTNIKRHLILKDHEIPKYKKEPFEHELMPPNFDEFLNRELDRLPELCANWGLGWLETVWNAYTDKPFAEVRAARSPKRAKIIKKAIEAFPNPKFWIALARCMNSIPFLKGQIEGSKGTRYVADFNYFARPDTMDKFLSQMAPFQRPRKTHP